MKLTSRMLLVLLVISALILAACGEDEPEQATPTPQNVAVSPTPIGAPPTPTPLPAISQVENQPPTALAGLPTLQPTAIIPPTALTVPTAVLLPTSPPPLAIGITAPAAGSILRGSVAVTGSASHPNFVQYALEYGPDPNPNNLWYPITSVPITTTVINGVLGGWNTTTVPDGNYQLRLHLWLNTGGEETRVVSGLQVRNTQIVTRQPNRNPQIDPISAIALTRGKSITIALGMRDEDNDPLTYVATVANPSIATVSPAGASAITINALADGTTNVTITVSDQRGGTASVSFPVTVVAPPSENNPPNLEAIPSQTINVGQSVTLNVNATDPDPGDSVTVTASSSAQNIAAVQYDSSNRNMRIIAGSQEGTASILVRATDSRGLSTNVAFLVSVVRPAPANNPPQIQAVGSQTLTVGSTVDVPVTITDPDNDTLSVEANSSNNGVVSAIMANKSTIRLNGVTAGTATITIIARDGRGGVATSSFNVTVNEPAPQNRPPTIADIGNQTVQQDETITVDVDVSDPDTGDTITVSAISQDESIVSVSVNNRRLTITGESTGTASIIVRATDGTSTAEKSFTVTVTERPNQPPSIQPIGDQTIEGLQTVTVPLTITDPDGDQLNISATSANGSVATAAVENSNLLITAQSGGTTDVTITVSDGAATATEIFTVTVNAAPPNEPPTINQQPGDLNLMVGESQTVTINAADPNNDALQYGARALDPAVAGATVSNNNQITVTGQSAGTTSILVDVSDGEESVSTSFNVTVQRPNETPTLQDIPDQSVLVNTSTTVQIVASDPNNDPLTINALSDNPGVATVDLVDSTLTINGIVPGQATVTVSVTDGIETVTDTFVVTVTAPANQPPTIQDIPDQTVQINASTTVTIVADDPDGAAPQLTTSIEPQGIANLNLVDNSLTITGVSTGTATVTVTASDGTDSATDTFNVTVEAAPNQPPTIQDIPDQGIILISESKTVNIVATDPDGTIPQLTAIAEPPGIVQVDLQGTTLTVTGLAQGTATVTVTASDGTDSASDAFQIIVEPQPVVNQAPVFVEAIPDQSADISQGAITVSANVVDPDGDPINLSAESSDQNVVQVAGVTGNQLTLNLIGTGSAGITVTASDGTDIATTSFNVTVSETAAPIFDVTQYPEMPTIDPNVAGQLSANHTVFSFAGDAPLASADFLPAPPYNLGNYGNLQAALDFYTTFGTNSFAAANGWTVSTLLDPAAAAPECSGASPLQCELNAKQPAVMFISFSPQSAVSMDINQFRQDLMTVVGTVRNAGALPIVATLPDDGSVPAETLAAYNQVIVEVATDPNINAPLWNLYNTMAGLPPANVYVTAGSGATDLSDQALSAGGINRRNLGALRVLELIRQTLFPNG